MKTATDLISFTHLAPGPYQYLGLDIDPPESDRTPLGQCQHCNTAIVYHFWLKGSDAKIFFVGSTCITKALLDTQSDLVAAVLDDRSKAEKRRNKNKLEQDYGRACNAIAENTHILCLEPHPKGFKTSSLLDYLRWFRSNAGKRKFISTAKSELKRLGLWGE
jgi:hypothetical protein